MGTQYCLKKCVAVAALLLFGCAEQPVSPGYQQGPAAPQAAVGEEDLIPPVPTFTSINDCELAYGPGNCGNGDQIYNSANLAPPPNASAFFMPFAFGVMTGVLVNNFFAPPTVYIADYRYGQFLAPVVVERYRVVTPAHIRFYHSAPIGIRQSVLRTGPVRYAPARGQIVGNPYGHNFVRPQGLHPAAVQFRQSHPSAAPHAPAPAVIQRQPTPAVHTPQPTPRPAAVAQPRPAPPKPAAVRPAPVPKPAPAPVKPKPKPCNPNLPHSATNCAK